MRKQYRNDLQGFVLVFLGAIYPVIFLYSNNAAILPFTAILPVSLIMVTIAVFLFGIFYSIQKSALRASLSSVVFLVFFYTYGSIYPRFENISFVQIEHYTVFPIFIVCALYAAFFLSKIRPTLARGLQNFFFFMLTVLVCVNIARILPAELKKGSVSRPTEIMAQELPSAVDSYPDIYFIIFDEYAGFDAIDGYWHDENYKEFIEYLQKSGFFIARHSHSATIDTIVEIASRLNMKQYPIPRNVVELFEPISNNRVMKILKAHGFTTVVIDGSQLAYPTKPDIHADFNFSSKQVKLQSILPTDEFSILFYSRTMLRIFENYYLSNPASQESFREMLFYSLEKVIDIKELPSPKFIYLHLMFPHWPFMFDENGKEVDATHQFDWNYYLGQHKYAGQVAQRLVQDILSGADPDNPPIIILQSDHGARNILDKGGEGEILENYPEEFKTNILNALYLPGYDYSNLDDDFSPVNTFAIILNYYLNLNITVK